jgi:cell division protein FtsN
MARDYAKRYKTTPKKRKKASLASRARSFFVCIIILGIIGAGIASYGYYHQHHADVTATNMQNEPVKPAPATAPVTNAQDDPINYEFYTLLPKINVPNPELNTIPPDQQPGFWLQLMVYYSMRDASAFVDRLQLSGLDPVITQRKSTKTDHDLFVVVLGPFSTKENAVAHQQDLKKMSVSSYVFHVDPTLASTETSATPDATAAPVSDAVAD